MDYTIKSLRFNPPLFVIIWVLVLNINCSGIKGKVSQHRVKQVINQKVEADVILDQAASQFRLLVGKAISKKRIPRTLDKKGNIHWTRKEFDWTEGFFPGTSWYFYELTKDQLWRKAAESFQTQFESHKYRINNHDLGFIFNCSYGNAYRLTSNEAFKQVMIEAGNSLITRFNAKVGCIKSWDVDSGWQAERGWKFPVIIDNMMNLELLFELTKLTGDPKYRDIAIHHANTTLKNHFRENNSSWHVVDYDPETGEVMHKHTAQGYHHNSTWARGQAWGLYGYVVAYRYTNNLSYLEQARKIANFIIADKRIEKDKIPYWDYDAPQKPSEPRDASAAAITAAALIELSQYAGIKYLSYAEGILISLSSDQYFAAQGTNQHFILKHSVGSIPHGNEIDVPLNYADYYFVEALMRYRETK